MQPIPENAKLAFQGVLFDVYQWPQTMFDGTTKTFEKLTRNDTGTVIAATPQGKIIMTVQKQPGSKTAFGLPGGRIEKGEEPLAAVQREFLEETGYAATNWKLWLKLYLHEKINYVSYTYLAKNAHKVRSAEPDAGESIASQLMTFEEFMNLMLDDSFRDFEVALGALRAQVDPGKFADLKMSLGLVS